MAIDKHSYSRTKHTGIKVHVDGIRFWFDFTVDGKRYSKLWAAKQSHTKMDRLKTAYNTLEELKNEITHANTIEADVEATVGSYWSRLKIVKNWNHQLEQKYEYYYNKHLLKLDKIKIKAIKPSHFTSLNVSLNHLAPRTRKVAYEILQPLFNLAVEDEIISKTPIKKSHIPVRKQIEEKKIVIDAEAKYRLVYETINKLFDTSQIITVGKKEIQCNINPHHRAIFLFGFHGRRVQEVLSLEWKDINFDTGTYIIRAEHSKVNTDMAFKLPSDVKQALLEFKDSSGKVFNVAKVEWHYPKIRLVSGIEEFTFHWMRNLAVSALSSMGADLTHLTAMLGHTDSSTLKKYLSLQREASTAVTNEMSTKLLGNIGNG